MSNEKIEYLFSNLKDFMSDKFNQINDRFDEHEKQQKIDFKNLENKINARFEEFENRVNNRFEDLETRINARFEEFENRVNNRFEDLETRINARFEEFENRVNDRFEDLETRINARFEEHEEKQRIDFAKLEYVMYDRTEALFDATEVSSDKDNSLYKKLKSLERVLDKHHYRITELESKII